LIISISALALQIVLDTSTLYMPASVLANVAAVAPASGVDELL
jgi:hypothetical protein